MSTSLSTTTRPGRLARLTGKADAHRVAATVTVTFDKGHEPTVRPSTGSMAGADVRLTSVTMALSAVDVEDGTVGISLHLLPKALDPLHPEDEPGFVLTEDDLPAEAMPFLRDLRTAIFALHPGLSLSDVA